jgi:hypothetical protein
MFDQAVVAFGVIVENACQEMVKVGTPTAPEWQPRYQLSDVLTPGFRLSDEQPRQLDPARLKRMHGVVYDEVG